MGNKWSDESVCDGCWEARNGDRVPYRLVERDTEVCCYCGRNNRSGIYVRVERAEVRYPSHRDEA